MNYLNYSHGNAIDLQVSDSVRLGIIALLRDAHQAIEKDIKSEKTDHIITLKKAKNFLEFYNKHEEDFAAFGHFLRDHGGAYDKMKAIYDWQHLYPVAYCIFAFHCKMPYRARLIELTAHYDWACLALDDSDICRYVTANFLTYAHIPDKFLTADGKTQTILERMYFRLHELYAQSPSGAGSYQWSLMGLLYLYLYADDFGF